MPSLSDGTPDCGSKRPQADIRRTLEMIPTLAWAASEDGSVDFLNRKWLEYTGLTLEEALGWGWKIGFHPDDQERVECRWREIVASRAPGELEARVCRHDGAFRWFMIRATPGRDKDGTVFEWFCTYTDIDTRKSAEILLVRTTEALRASEHLAKGQLKMLTRTLTVMAQETDPDRLLEHVLATIGGQLGSHSIAVCEYREGTIVRIADCGKGHLHFLTPDEIDAAPRQPVATIFHPIWSNFFQHGAHCVLAEIDVNPRLRLAGVPNAPTYDSWQKGVDSRSCAASGFHAEAITASGRWSNAGTNMRSLRTSARRSRSWKSSLSTWTGTRHPSCRAISMPAKIPAKNKLTK
jgi:PAS domain S-box-containing protein